MSFARSEPVLPIPTCLAAGRDFLFRTPNAWAERWCNALGLPVSHAAGRVLATHGAVAMPPTPQQDGRAAPVQWPRDARDGSRQPALAALILAAAKGLHHIRGGGSGTLALAGTPAAVRPGAQALLFHTLRHLGLAQALRSLLAPRMPSPAADALLCTALALAAAPGAIEYEAFTLVNQAVDAAKLDPATRKQASFINACLRRFLRESGALMEAVQTNVVARWNYPSWWVERVQRDWPDEWQAILQAGNEQAPMVLRINQQKTTPAQYLQALQAIKIIAFRGDANALVLQRAVPVQALPGFAEGAVSVQDASAQRAAPLLLAGFPQARSLRVLDACAAPGGKTAHLLELSTPVRPVRVTALEIDPARCTRITETLARLGLSAQVLAHDASRPQDWWQQHCGGELFDAILLDAPCTASGIVRRHPDVRWLRRASDIAQLAQIQANLLAALWPLVAPGGRLLYCTCSVFPEEGAQQIQTFLGRHENARLLPSPGHILPEASDMYSALADNPRGGQDGFFYALLQKFGD